MKTIVKMFLLGLGIVFMMSACGGGGSSTTNTSLAPSISAQPSNVSMIAGNNTTFSVTAGGTGLSYKWQVDSGSGFTNISDTGVYSGTATSTLSLSDVTISMNSYKYRVVVTGTVAPSVTSTSATLTVAVPTQAEIIVSVAGLPATGVSAAVNFDLKIPNSGVTPFGLVGTNADAAVTLITPSLSAAFSATSYDAATHLVSFAGFVLTSVLIDGQLMKITCDITSNTPPVVRSDFSITASSVDSIAGPPVNYPATFPLSVIFK